MQKRLSKKEFQKEYTLWIQSAAKDIAFALNQLKPGEMKKIIQQNEQYLKEPESVYGIDGLEVVEDLVSPDILLLSTDAVVFSQSIFVRMASVFDYAVALNRRYYLGKWYPIITLNKKYLEEASETMLKYTIEHELLQKKIYEENMRDGVRKFSPDEKRKISDETLIKAIEKSGITEKELEKEKQIMLRISTVSPLIPKPFAETALYWYVEKNIEELKTYGMESRTDKEDELGKKLNADFKEWIDFSTNTYKMFLSDVKKELNYMDYGYA
jgi:hypothetical protein